VSGDPIIAPGDVTGATYDGGRMGTACVLETSMHKAVCDDDAARSEIVNHYDDDTKITWEHDCWWSVLASDCEVDDIPPGGWHSNGTGARWVKVLIGFPEATS